MLRKNVASQVVTFTLVNASNGAALTGATVTVKVTLDGTQASGVGTVTELGSGQYKYVPTQAETNGNSVGFLFTATGAVPANLHAYTTAGDPTDAVRFGLTALPNANAEAAGGLYTRGSGAGQINQPANGMIDANVVRNAGTAITAASGVQEVKVASIAADAITASSIATDAIGALELAAGAASEIATAVRTELATELARVDVATSTRLATASYAAPLDAAGTRSAVGLASANLDTQLSTIAGYIDTEVAALMTNVSTVLTRLGVPSSDVSTLIAAIKAKTDNLPAAPAATGDAMALTVAERASVADKFLGRTLSGSADGGRTVKDALRASRNKVVIDGTTITVYAEDDTTVAWTGTVVRDSALDALSTVDPA